MRIWRTFTSSVVAMTRPSGMVPVSVRPLSRAIGPTAMYDTLLASPGFVDFVRTRAETFGIGVEYAVLDEVDLPAYAGTLNLRYGRVDASPTPAAGASAVPSETP